MILVKLTYDYVKQYIENESQSGYILLSSSYKNAREKLELQCDKGHEIFVSFDLFKNKGTRCPHCKNIARYTIDYVKYHIEIESNSNYSLLSNYYKNNKTELLVRCDNDHVFRTHFDMFKNRGCRCPHCHLMELSKMMTGRPRELHPSFKPELTDDDREYKRNIVGYKEWVFSVLKRDNFVCQCCKKHSSGDLNAHHLDSYDWCVDKRTDISNGITLCKICHYNFHKKYGYGNNSKEQFQDYLKVFIL